MNRCICEVVQVETPSDQPFTYKVKSVYVKHPVTGAMHPIYATTSWVDDWGIKVGTKVEGVFTDDNGFLVNICAIRQPPSWLQVGAI